MNPMRVVSALEALGSRRRFFAPEYKELLDVGRKTFFHVFGKVESMNWFDLGAMQAPVDYMAYMECVMRRRPRVIVETGTASGASAAFYLELLKRAHPDGNVKVITVEINESQINRGLIADSRIVSLIGSSVDREIVKRVYGLAGETGGAIMVMLDSCHSARHVAEELGCYADLVSPEQYLVVQDTYLGLFWGGSNMDQEAMRAFHEGRGPNRFDYADSPLGAVEAFLSIDQRFQVDMRPQRWIFTQCPFGFLEKANA